jgi:hypothetical protein
MIDAKQRNWLAATVHCTYILLLGYRDGTRNYEIALTMEE